MQILRSGMSVHARRRRWRVVDARAYDDCELVTLQGVEPANAGRETRLIVPFDLIEPVQAAERVRLVRSARWRHACRELLANAFSEAHLCAAGRAHIDLLPHQLEPAIAVVRGHGCRLLLADDVGLGKTIQAGLAIAELRARGAADRVLIVTPAGLRDQWADELSQRFGIQADIVDFRGVARRASGLPYGVNPWTTWPVAIASMDYVKRAEVLPAVAACSWDAIVVDEAHGLANDSDRHEAVAALAARAAYVFLLTATPHNGDAGAFRSLCAIGGRHDRLLVFRRTRDAVQSGTRRRVHRLLVRQSDEERRMHARLAEFGRAVRAERGDLERDVWLALAVLHKRAYSSAHALQQTVARRLAAIEPDAGAAAQLTLPLDDRGEGEEADEAPAWQEAIALRDRALERRLLTALAVAAGAAAIRESKLRALARLLNRIAEPVIVFTEYRDTLAHVAQHLDRPAAILHGGLSRRERTEALRAFAAGERPILLATDAAGVGLNLQRAGRTVVNLELPWNPMRLEQRIGRVDRIGQRRTVHAFHLVAAGTGEQRLLADLEQKVARARSDLGAPNPLGDSAAGLDGIDFDRWGAQLVIDGSIAASVAPAASRRDGDGLASFRADAALEAQRLATERALAGRSLGRPRAQPAGRGPLAAIARNARTRARLGTRVLMLWEVSVEDGCGRCVLSQPVATAIALTRRPPGRIDRRWIDALLTAAASRLPALVESSAAPDAAAALSTVSSFVAARVAREQQIARTRAASAFQPGLFDRRGHHAHAAARAAEQQIALASARRLALLERQAVLSVSRPALRLLLFP